VSVERSLLISLLKLTKEGPVLIENINRDARIPSSVTWDLLEKMQLFFSAMQNYGTCNKFEW